MRQRFVHPNGKPAGAPHPGALSAAAPRPATLLGVWIAIIGYLVLFYAAPLPGSGLSDHVVRRVEVLISALYPDELVGHWLRDASWDGLAQRAAIGLTASTIFAVAWVAGWLLLQWSGANRRLTRLETFVLSAGVGLNVTSLSALALGLAGIMHRGVYAALAAVVIACACSVCWAGARRADSEPGDHAELPRGAADPSAASTLVLGRRWLWLAVPFVAVIALGAMMPPVDFDVREYHLQAPKEFYQQGRVTFLPHNVYANMPLGTEMLSLTGMIVCGDWWTGALVGKTLIALFSPLAALLLLAAGRRLATPTAGIVAAMVYVSIPWMALVSMHGLVEGGLAFYLFGALYGVLLWQRSIDSDEPNYRWLWLAGFLAGGAVSTKYPAVLFSVVPLSAWIVAVSLVRQPTDGERRPRLVRTLIPLAAFLAFVVLGCGLWLAKNAALTGNPVYPLLYDTFGGATRTEELNQQWNLAHRPRTFLATDFAQRSYDAVLRSPWLSPIVAPLAILGFFTPRRRLVAWLAAYLCFVFVAWWLLTHRIDRFWIPVLPVAALMAGIGATWTGARGWRVPLVGLLLLTLASNFVTISSGALGDARYLADLDSLRFDGRRVDPWHLYLNVHAHDVSGVLLVGDAQPFDLEVPSQYNTVFDPNLFEQLVRGKNAEQVRAALADRDISHVYVNWREFARYLSPGNYGFSRFVRPDVFRQLVDAGVLAPVPSDDDDNPNELYRVVPASPERAADEDSR